MRFQLPRIYPITDVSISGLSHLEQAKLLIEGGARIIQLRDKHASPQEFYESCKSVIDFASGSDVKIIINDRVDFAFILNADGVHLGQDDLGPALAREILGKTAIIGFSTHTRTQAIEAIKFPIDYLAIGPVFATKTKEDSDQTIGVEGVKNVREAIGDFPLVAIGGIDFETAQTVLTNGADSVAMIGALLKPAHKISKNMRNFVERL